MKTAKPKQVEAYETHNKIIVMYNDTRDVPEEHSCDEMGCGSFSHVRFRLDKPYEPTTEKSNHLKK